MRLPWWVADKRCDILTGEVVKNSPIIRSMTGGKRFFLQSWMRRGIVGSLPMPIPL